MFPLYKIMQRQTQFCCLEESLGTNAMRHADVTTSISKRSVYLQYVKGKGTLTYRRAAETTFL